MSIIIYLLLISMFFYIGMLLWFIVGNMFSDSISDSKDTPAVSVIIAIRNGEDALSHLLTNLSSQDYSGEMEFILVDDESENSTKKIPKNSLRRMWTTVNILDWSLEQDGMTQKIIRSNNGNNKSSKGIN